MTDKKQPAVLCGIDGSNISEAVCDYASWIAKKINAPLKLLHTIEHNPIPAVADLTGTLGLGTSEELLQELTQVEQERSRLLIEQGNQMLKAARERAVTNGVSQVDIRQRHGALAESLIDMEEQIRVLVVGIRGEQHQQKNSGVGTQLESTIRALHKPIFVVNKAFNEPRTIMLAYNGSDAANKALDLVSTSPLFKGMPCHLVYVGDDEPNANQLLAVGERQLAASGVEVKKVKLKGKLEDVLAQYQIDQNIDLMVMGAFGHSRIREILLGSFTAKMLEKTQRPLLLLR
jgi:nucleotide-binding universal stress UspA family protein